MQNLYRIIDANLNRSREGLRVIEDIIRFSINDPTLCRSLKKLRHELSFTVLDTKKLIHNRNSRCDVGRKFDKQLEGGAKKLRSLVTANFRRIEESLRVLEEIYKIFKPHKAKLFKTLRFKTYTLEKRVYEKI